MAQRDLCSHGAEGRFLGEGASASVFLGNLDTFTNFQ